VRLLKKNDGDLREGKKVKYAFIESLVGEFAITKMCKWLTLHRSGFYKWRNRTISPREQKKESVRTAVVDVYYHFKKRYGAPRIAEELNETGVPCSVNHVAQLLQSEGLRARNGKNFKYMPSACASSNVADNILARNFKASKPDDNKHTSVLYFYM